MSSLAVPVVEYAAEVHPNADALELAVVGGWRAACRIGQFAPGQKVAYIPEGSLLPWDLVVELNLHDPPRLAGPDRNRVKAIRLRGVLSQGIVYGGERIAGLSVGDDAAEALGVVKWVPPVPVHMSGLMVPGPKIGYDIDDIKSWPDRIVEGEEVVVTEKLHGSFCCLGLRRESPGAEPEPVVSSKGQLGQGLRFDVGAEANTDNLYVRAWREHAEAIGAEFDRLGEQAEAMYFFGEVCGPKVQDLVYGLSVPRFHVFDLRLDGGYAPWDEVTAAAGRAGIPICARAVAGSMVSQPAGRAHRRSVHSGQAPPRGHRRAPRRHPLRHRHRPPQRTRPRPGHPQVGERTPSAPQRRHRVPLGQPSRGGRQAIPVMC